MKKILVLLLCMSFFTGCSSQTDTPNDTANNNRSTENVTENENNNNNTTISTANRIFFLLCLFCFLLFVIQIFPYLYSFSGIYFMQGFTTFFFPTLT